MTVNTQRRTTIANQSTVLVLLPPVSSFTPCRHNSPGAAAAILLLVPWAGVGEQGRLNPIHIFRLHVESS